MAPDLQDWTGTWAGDWKWGLLLIVLTVSMHTAGLILVAAYFHHVEHHIRRIGLAGLIVLTASLSLVISLLIGVEVAVWAWAYVILGALPTFHLALFYSLTMITTTGADVVDLAPHWRLMGVLEAVSGVLVAGLSTAFMFAALQRLWPPADERRQSPRGR